MPTTPTLPYGTVLQARINKLAKSLRDGYKNLPSQQKSTLDFLLICAGVGASGYGLYKLLNKQQTPPPSSPPLNDADEAKRQERQQKQKQKHQIDSKFFARLKFLLSIVVPSFKSKEFLQLLALACVVICRTLVSNQLSSLSGDISKVLMEYDWPQFVNKLGVSTSLSVISAILAPTLSYLIHKNALEWRIRLTKHVHDKYLQNMMYYKTANLSNKVKNPDQVVAQDIKKFCDGMCGLFANLVKPFADIILYTSKLVQLTGWAGPIFIVSYMFFSWILISVIRPNFGALTSKNQVLEGNFRYCHVRTATNGESIAFYGGDSLEKSIADKSFDQLFQHKRHLIKTKFQFGIFNDFFVFNLPQSVSWIISALPVFFGNMKDHERSNLARDLRYLAAVITHEFQAIGELIRLRTRLSELAGYTNNVSELLETIDEFQQQKKESGSIKEGSSIKFENVSIIPPGRKEALVKNITFEVVPGKNVLVTGPNGSGKSALFRMLGGLWPVKEGFITKPGGDQTGLFKEIYYIPQRPYNVIGTLRDQITYPHNSDQKPSDEEIKEYIKLVRIEKIIEREGGLDVEKNWDDILSLGEQQRLAMARLFYHKPKFAILDECTSAVSVDIEKDLYLSAKKLGITCITISLRPALKAYHDVEVRLDGEGGYQIHHIKHDENKTN